VYSPFVMPGGMPFVTAGCVFPNPLRPVLAMRPAFVGTTFVGALLSLPGLLALVPEKFLELR